MHDIDQLLSVLRSRPVPSQLNDIEDAVLTGLARHRDRLIARRGLAIACVMAAFMGLAAGAGTEESAAAERLLGVPAAAPSHLLAS
jgi:hypothetical protein